MRRGVSGCTTVVYVVLTGTHFCCLAVWDEIVRTSSLDCTAVFYSAVDNPRSALSEIRRSALPVFELGIGDLYRCSPS